MTTQVQTLNTVLYVEDRSCLDRSLHGFSSEHAAAKWAAEQEGMEFLLEKALNSESRTEDTALELFWTWLGEREFDGDTKYIYRPFNTPEVIA